MNRNNERHFNSVPETHVSRTRFNRDQNILTTFDAGKLIPFYVDEVIPGDTFSVDTAAIIRMTTPKYPVMDDSFIDFYYLFCPNRILWDKTPDTEQNTLTDLPQITEKDTLVVGTLYGSTSYF